MRQGEDMEIARGGEVVRKFLEIGGGSLGRGG